MWCLCAVLLFCLPAGCSLLEEDEPVPRSVDEAIEMVIAISDPCEGGAAQWYLVDASLTDASVVGAVVDAVRAQKGDARGRLVFVLTLIWTEHDDPAAEAALTSLLGDPDIGLGAAIGLAEGGSAAGADLLRTTAVQNVASGEEAQRTRDEARFWLGELGLDWKGATPPPAWTDTFPLGPDGVAVFEGAVVAVSATTWGQQLPRITVDTDELATELVVTMPWDAEVLSGSTGLMDGHQFINTLRDGQSFDVRITAEDTAGSPWATKIEVLSTK